VLWATFGLGFLTVLPVLVVGVPIHLLVSLIEQPVVASIFEAFFVAAIPEEFFKLVVLVGYSMRTRAFDEPMDGIVYGVVASLGFATFENMLYVLDGGTGVALSRAFSAVPLHAFLGAIMGYFVGQAWKNPERRFPLLVQAYAIAVVLHGIYDFPLMTMSALGSAGPHLPLAFATLAVLVIAWNWSLRLTRTLRKEQLMGRIIQVVPGIPEVIDAPRAGSRVIPIVQIAFGVISSSVGGMVVLGLFLAFILGIVASEDTSDVLMGGAMIGLMPLVVGVLVFRHGVKGLNRKEPMGNGELGMQNT